MEFEPEVVGGVKWEDIEKLNVVPLGAVLLRQFDNATTGYILIHDNGEFKNVPVDNRVHVLVLAVINAEYEEFA